MWGDTGALGEKGNLIFFLILNYFPWVFPSWGECEGWYLSNCDAEFYLLRLMSGCLLKPFALGVASCIWRCRLGLLFLGDKLLPISKSLFLRSLETAFLFLTENYTLESLCSFCMLFKYKFEWISINSIDSTLLSILHVKKSGGETVCLIIIIWVMWCDNKRISSMCADK